MPECVHARACVRMGTPSRVKETREGVGWGECSECNHGLGYGLPRPPRTRTLLPSPENPKLEDRAGATLLLLLRFRRVVRPGMAIDILPFVRSE